MKRDYDINGVHCVMTESQADRWNAGRTTVADLRSVRVVILESNGYREITLRRACNPRLEPWVAALLAGQYSASENFPDSVRRSVDTNRNSAMLPTPAARCGRKGK